MGEESAPFGFRRHLVGSEQDACNQKSAQNKKETHAERTPRECGDGFREFTAKVMDKDRGDGDSSKPIELRHVLQCRPALVISFYRSCGS